MSGTIGNNIGRHSGSIAVTAAGLSWDTAVVTGSTVTVVAGNGYWINTTSNACTITLPSSAEAGDQIVIIDYARTWGTNKIIIDSNGLNYQGQADTYTVEYTTDGQALNIVYADSTNGWLPLEDDVVADEPVAPPTQKAIYYNGSTNVSNLISSSGVVGNDVSAVGTGRYGIAGGTYGGDKAIFMGGATNSGDVVVSMSNLVNNSGVVGADVTGVPVGRADLAGSTYGFDKVILYGGYGDAANTVYNLVNNVGVVAANVVGAPTGRAGSAGCQFGSSGQALFAFGTPNISLSFIVTNVGVPGSNVTGVGTVRKYLGCASFGGDRCVFGFGSAAGKLNMSNKVSNTGIVASDTTGVGTARHALGGSGYGGDKGLFAYGFTAAGAVSSLKNLVSNSGTVAADVTGVGTARQYGAMAGYSQTA